MMVFSTLFRALRKGGTYIMEGIENSYNPNLQHSYLDLFKLAIDNSVNSLYYNQASMSNHRGSSGGMNKSIYEQIPQLEDIASISFEQNLVIIRKIDSADEIYRRIHRHSPQASPLSVAATSN